MKNRCRDLSYIIFCSYYPEIRINEVPLYFYWYKYTLLVMQDIVASVEGYDLEIDTFLHDQVGLRNLPFYGMDKSRASICEYYMKDSCARGSFCPLRHVRGQKTVVCKHWLRYLCKKGDDCEFLHEYDMSKMPECYFYSKFRECNNKDCKYLHIDPESKVKECAWYLRGFCKHGPYCKHKHLRRVICINYVGGFCPEGPKCKYLHPKFEIPQLGQADQMGGKTVICHTCQQPGHKSVQCPQGMPAPENTISIPLTGPNLSLVNAEAINI